MQLQTKEVVGKISNSIMDIYIPVMMNETKKGKGYITFEHDVDYSTYRALRDNFLKVENNENDHTCCITWEFDYDFRGDDKIGIKEQLLQETMRHRISC